MQCCSETTPSAPRHRSWRGIPKPRSPPTLRLPNERQTARHQEVPIHQNEIRQLIADVEASVSAVEKSDAAPKGAGVDEVRRSWDALTKFLNVGPAPRVRACPSCGRDIVHAAIRCMHCWAKSLPPEEEGAGKPAPRNK